MLKRIPPILKNFYFLFALFFFVWMLVFDSNDLISQIKLKRKLSTLESQKEYYLEKITEVKKDREELMSDVALLEKFAREKYLMKRDSEDLYIIVEEDE